MTKAPMALKIHPNDNVAVATEDISLGTEAIEGIKAKADIPMGHKIALVDMKKGSPVLRYGTLIGNADRDISAGEWINEHNLTLPTPPELDEMPFGTNIVSVDDLPGAPVLTFEGYPNPDGGYAGTRNILGIMTTVQCVTGVLNIAVERIRNELLPKYPNVDAVVPINHPYGCGVAIDAPDAKIPIRGLKNMLRHPNFGGEVMLIALGCEKLTPERLLDDDERNPENLLVLQEQAGFGDMIDAIMEMAERKLQKLNLRKRETLPLSKLIIGMQCGGSDAFSGITANPAAGYASDMLVKAGATVLFSEVTEIRDAVYILAERSPTKEVFDALVSEMKWYDDYLDRGGVDRSANTTPGNKRGGLSNIVEKALGSIAKSGSAPIAEVIGPGERPTKHGLIYAATPASDIVCGPMQLTSGITLQVFMTGRGTPYGLAAAPVIKVSSAGGIASRWNDIIDINAGTVLEGKASIEEVGRQLFEMIVDTASGRVQPWAEKWNLHNDFCLFNPAPIT